MKSKDDSVPDEQQSSKVIVCIYAQRDEQFYRELQTDLILWQNKHFIRWLELSPGDAGQTLLDFVQEADLILLLMSSSFFAVRICHKAMESAIEERERRGVPVVPILARASDWKESECGDLSALPENELPIAEWEHQERAYENIRKGLAPLIGIEKPLESADSGRLRSFPVRDLPTGYVPRPKAFHEIKSKLLATNNGHTTAITTALRGVGGFGKTTLALALCHDVEIQAAFPDGILWVELGEQPPRTLDLLNSLLTSLERDQKEAITLEEAQGRWRVALQDRVLLLVIDDVWQAQVLQPLLEGGLRCLRLVTTRNDQLLPDEAERVWVDAMEPQEAMAVLCQRLANESQQVTHQVAFEALARRLGCWPLLLSLAHGMLMSLVSLGESVAEALAVVNDAYQTHGVMAFHLGHGNERQRTADACLEVSLRHLEEFTHARYQAQARYQELVVFPEDTDIPIATLQVFWKGTAGLEEWQTIDLCMQLYRLSLLLTCDLGKGTIRLHDALRNYLIQRIGPNLPALHSRFLDKYQQVLGLIRWADLSADEHYLWQHLVLHLCHASRIEDLRTTLTDLGYLTRKALYVGVPALEADLLLASTSYVTANDEPTQSFFASLHRSIVRISHLLQLVQTPTEMGGLLLSHLGWEPSFATQRVSFDRKLLRPFLTAWHPLPEGASSALLRTVYGHTNLVNSCAISPDSRLIVSASYDSTLKIWDASSGALHLSLISHTNWVRSCAISPDSRFIVSASSDHTLKVWDASSEAKHLFRTGHTSQARSCAISPDQRFIVSASKDHTLKVWDTTTGAERLSLIGHTNSVNGCAISPDNRFIVSASSDRTLKIWDTSSGTERLSLIGHTDWINGCAISPDNRFIVSASSDRTLKIWDASSGALHLSRIGHTGGVNDCAISPDNRFIVSASEDHTLKVWNASSGALHLSLIGHTNSVNSCAISLDNRFIVSASWDRTLKIWDIFSGTLLLSLTGHNNGILGCAISPDNHFIVSASWDHTLKIWDTQKGYCLLTFPVDGALTSCAFHPDGKHIVACGEQGVYFFRLVV